MAMLLNKSSVTRCCFVLTMLLSYHTRSTCKAHLCTSPFNIMAEACAGDKLINLKNEKQLLGGPKKQTNKNHFRRIKQFRTTFKATVNLCELMISLISQLGFQLDFTDQLVHDSISCIAFIIIKLKGSRLSVFLYGRTPYEALSSFYIRVLTPGMQTDSFFWAFRN